jgi:hypothetical protein
LEPGEEFHCEVYANTDIQVTARQNSSVLSVHPQLV